MYIGNINKIILISFCQRFHLYVHAYALLLLARGLTLLQISLIESIVIGAIFLLEVPTGLLADRLGRKWSIFLSTFLLMGAEFLFIFARDFSWYVLIALMTGAGFAFASGAVEALLYDSLPPEGREDAMKRALGRVNSFSQIAFVIAPLVGGLIIGDARAENFIPAIALTVLALLLGLLVCFRLQEPARGASDADAATSWSLLRAGVALLLQHRRLRRLVLLAVFSAPFTAALVTTLAPPYLIQNAAPPFVTGVALSLGSLLAAFTQRYVYKLEEWLGQPRAIAFLILLPGALYWLLALAAGPLAPLLVLIVMYGSNDMKAPLFSAYQNALIASENRATVLSLINMLLSLFLALVAPLYATLGQQSLATAFLLMGAVIIVAALLLRVHRLPAAA